MSNAGAGRLQLRGDEMLPGNKRDHQPMSTTSILALLVSTLQRARGQAASITVCVSVSAGINMCWVRQLACEGRRDIAVPQ